ncbi:unnamed protein product [Schistosoma bovis]|nr:unnamed protein product [Schistosoma bovis]
MLTILVHRIPKFTQTVFTFETKFSNWINGSLIGSLSLSDENSSLASCGSVQFNIVPGSNYLPVAIDETTGILKVIESDYETMKNNPTITFQVTVRNSNTSLNISDDATVNILIGENNSDEETGSEITAVKRGVILPPNTINVTFSRVYIQDNPNYCLFDTWFIDSFTFTTDEFSASIGHISLTLPTTFSTYPEGYKIDTQQFVGGNFALTTIGYVSVSNLQNPGVYDTTLPMMNRSVRLTVFIRIYRPSLVSVKFEAKISPLGKNSTVNFCESQVKAFAGPNLVANNVLTLKDTSVVNQAEKLQFFNLQLSILPSTAALYSVYVTYTGKIKAEPCSVDYLLTETNSTKKVSKTPVVTIEKVEPRNSQPTVNFSTIVEVRVKFFEDFVYMPITFQLQVNSNEAIIIRQSIQTIGYLLKAVALVGYDFSVKP